MATADDWLTKQLRRAMTPYETYRERVMQPRPRRLACSECGDVVTLRGPIQRDPEEFRCHGCINRESSRSYSRRRRAKARARREVAA